MSNTLTTFAGYVVDINNKIKVSFHSSYKSADTTNCPNAFSIKVNLSEVIMTYDEICDLIDHLKEIRNLHEQIPNKDNPHGYLNNGF